ncbi:MAG: E3 binding domain-containing protein, partial [Alphaproteobacteria bacterium]|nr:E3 binding domain-containing protein [Alphaproteobacteria bacterium]MDX5368775.1 E3 binding domain-containing protein [Alphaproteobacteria bacterium]MDX5463511.1 E3 binding domain-containing protein [Alphaproteobacteria bacterium]
MATPITIGAAGGEYMESVVVVEWRVKPGDTVKAGEVVAVVETAKAATEVTAPCDGTMGRILAEEGAEVGVKDPIGLIGEGELDTPPAQASGVTAPAEKSAPAAPTTPRKPGRVVASPVARKVAAREGVDLAGLAGTGPRGRIKRRDVEAALRGAGAAPEAASFAEEAGPLAVTRGGGGEG